MCLALQSSHVNCTRKSCQMNCSGMPATSLLWNTCARTACVPAKPSFRRCSPTLSWQELYLVFRVRNLPSKTQHTQRRSHRVCALQTSLLINEYAALRTQVLDPALPAPCPAERVRRNDSACSCRCADHAVPCPGSHSRQACHTPQPHSVGAGHRPAVLGSISQYMSVIHTGTIRTQCS